MTKIAKNVKYALVSYNAKINWFVFFLVIAWSWGGWLEIFSVTSNFLRFFPQLFVFFKNGAVFGQITFAERNFLKTKCHVVIESSI
jgi:hypothetical protein